MRSDILVPCACGKIHKFADPGQNTNYTCTASGVTLNYICREGAQYQLIGQAQSYNLLEDSVSVGRELENTIVLQNPELSRRHCLLERTDEGFNLTDLNSANGSFVNEVHLQPGQPYELQPGDLIRLGETYLRFVAPLPNPDTSTQWQDEGFASDTTLQSAEKKDEESTAANDPMVGRQLGDFLITGYMAKGGMGRVYLAEQLSLKRKCVVKTVLPEKSASESSIKRFLQEVRVGASVSHPNIVVFYGAGQEDDICYVAMEYFESKDLNRIYKRNPAPIATAAALVRQVANALAATHEQRIIHRDIKPQNVLCNENGHIKIIDFGLAKVWQDSHYAQLTASDGILGSPAYMSPEQVMNPRDITHLVDIYGLGVLLFFCLTGRPPFVEETPIEVLYKVRFGIPRPSEFCENISEALDNLILKAAHVEPQQRFPSASAFIEALDQACPPE